MGTDGASPHGIAQDDQNFSMIFVVWGVDAIRSPCIAENLFADDFECLPRPDEWISIEQRRF